MQLALTGLGFAVFLCGLVLLAAWGRRQLIRLQGGGVDPRCLEVVSRIGLHANQGLAVVRVGRRKLLLSTGEGGARLLTELTEEDLEVDEADGTTDFASTLRLYAGERVRRTVGLGVVVLGLLATGVHPASAQATFDPYAVPGGPGAIQQPGVPGIQDPFAPAGQFAPVFEALPDVALRVGDDEEGLSLNGTVGTVIILGLLSLAPSLLLLTTSFTRIYIVLQLLRQALGTQNTPPGHLLAAMALLLTTAVMAPTINQIRVTSVDPWVAGEIEDGEMLTRAVVPLRSFMFSQTRPQDLQMFMQISRTPAVMGPADVPNTVLMSAFVTSELRAAFEIGFAIFLPFIVIDLVVAAVLTSMGMFMLPPTMIALPCKLMLFVLMDGWSLLLGTLAQSFL